MLRGIVNALAAIAWLALLVILLPLPFVIESFNITYGIMIAIALSSVTCHTVKAHDHLKNWHELRSM